MDDNQIVNSFITHGASFVIGFVFGLLVSWIIHRVFIHKKENVINWERSIISVVVLFVWTISVVLDIAIVSYHTPAAVHGLMGLVTGYFFEGNILEAIGNRSKKQ